DFEELSKEVRAGKLDAVVRGISSPAKVSPENDVSLNFEIHFVSTSPGGQGALAFIEQRLTAANEVEMVRVLRYLKRQELNISSRVVRLVKTPLEEAGGGAFISLAALVPLILILMTITGAVYPAIDLTAGERERGTLEILVSAPVPRLGLLFAKYV